MQPQEPYPQNPSPTPPPSYPNNYPPQPPTPIQSSNPQYPQQPYQPQVPYDRDDESDGMPQPTYYSRPVMPADIIVPPDIQQAHEDSKRMYPMLNLSTGEYVIGHVRRHPIGLVKIWGLAFLGIATVLTMVMLFSGSLTSSTSGIATGATVPPAAIALIAIFVILLAVIIGMVGTWVYRQNNMYLTNESVIQNIQMTLFAHRKQTVSLGNIEDASYAKPGIVASMFDYGEIRLSTEGDETTYRFPYAANPDKQVALLNNAIEAFKNGRPIKSDTLPTH